jgi:hypothetical protein
MLDELYTLRDDPGMLKNLAVTPEGEARAAELGRAMLGLMSGQLESARRGEGGDYTPEDREMLRALGYLR